MKKQLLTKTLLMAVMLLGGANSVWGDSYNATPYNQDYETETTYAQGWTYSNMSPSWANNSGNHYLLFTQTKNASASISFASDNNFTTATDYSFSFKMNMNYHMGSKTTTVTVTGTKNGESVTLFKIVSKDNVDGYNGTSHVFKSDDTEIATFTNGGYGNSATMTPTIPFVLTSNSTNGTKLSVNGGDAVTLDDGLVTISGISISTGNSSALKVSFDDMKLESNIYYNKTLYSQDYTDADTYKTGWTTNGNGSINQLVSGGVTYLELAHDGTKGSGQSGTFTFATASSSFASAEDYCWEFDFAHSGTHGKGNSSSFTFTTTDDATLFKMTNANNYASAIELTNSSEASLGSIIADGYTSTDAYSPSYIYHFAIYSSASGTYLQITDKDGVLQINQKVAEGLVHMKSISYVNARYYRHTIFGNMTLKEHATEVVSDPAINVVVSGANRTVTIESGETSLDYSLVKTYYTTDGSAPSSASTLYTSPITINTASTVKAISIGQAGGESDIVSSGEITVGAITLNAPTVTMDLTADDAGNYYVPAFTFSQDQSDLSYVPTSVTLSYTVNSGDAVEATTYNPTEAGVVTVTVAAEGYTSASISFNVPYLVYKKTTTLDFTTATYPSGQNFTAGTSNVATAYNSVNKVNNSLTGISVPEALAGYLAFQEIYNGSGNGWGIRVNGTSSGLFGYGSARAAAVLGRTAGQIVAFNCSSDASNTITYTNKSGNPDGNYTMQISSDQKTYYATMTANDRIGFCRNAFGNYILSIVIYDPVTSVSATIGSTGYTTFSSAFPLALGSMETSTGDATAYYASTINTTGGYVSLTTIDTDVEDGEGLILKGTPEATITIPVAASGSAIDGNKLVGCTTETTLTSATPNVNNFYVLVNGATAAEFQNLATYVASHNVTIPAGKAYLDATGVGAARLSIVFDDNETTGIRLTENSELRTENVVYDLQGRRVMNAQKGLYIINGKKVVIK